MSENRFKPLYKYIAKAKQLESVDPIVCYSLRFYAAQLALNFTNRTADESQILSDLVTLLEQTNQCIKGVDKSEIKLHVESFALQIFDRADDIDRNTGSTRDTAAQFHTAYILFDSCKQFGTLDTDIADKLKYSMWKATDILKSIKEGKQPMKGGVGEQHSNDVINDTDNTAQTQTNTSNATAPADTINRTTSVNSNTSSTAPPPATNPSYTSPTVPPTPSYAQAAAAVHMSPSLNTSPNKSVQSTTQSKQQTSAYNNASIPSDRVTAQKEAERQIKHAMSAIAFDDIDTCVVKLQNALHCLQPYAKHNLT